VLMDIILQLLILQEQPVLPVIHHALNVLHGQLVKHVIPLGIMLELPVFHVSTHV
jgi:hypothetical protein